MKHDNNKKKNARKETDLSNSNSRKKNIHHAFTPISFPSLSFLGEYKWKILCNSECELGEGEMNGNEYRKIKHRAQ